MKSYRTMLKTEMKLSLRGMDMPLFAWIFPIIMLIVLGGIYGSKPAFKGADYTFMQQSFGAIATIAICAGGVMGIPLVISDYRSKKILKRFKVTPISPVTILLAEITMYFIYASLSLISLFIISTIFFDFSIRGSIAVFLAGWLLVLISMFSIGIMVGGIAKNSKIAGVIASALYFPMIIFSGATLPYEVMPSFMKKAAEVLPLTQGIKILKSASLGNELNNMMWPVIIMVVICIVCTFISIRFFKWE